MFDGYAPYKGDFQYRKQGSLIAFEAGEAVTYGLFAAQELSLIHIQMCIRDRFETVQQSAKDKEDVHSNGFHALMS